MKIFDRFKKKKEESPCADGHNCEAIDTLDQTQMDVDKRIAEILKSDSFSKLMKQEPRGD